MEARKNSARLVDRLLNDEEIKQVVGGVYPSPHTQNGSSYTQDGSCDGGYFQAGNAGDYNQSCKP